VREMRQARGTMTDIASNNVRLIELDRRLRRR
jgi:hypothetical protein